MHTQDHLIDVVVRAVGEQSPVVRSYELVAADGADLPAFTAGAHVDLHLANGMLRSYSLLGDPADSSCYQIAVRRDDLGRGGSLHIHRQLACGQHLRISAPRNAFALDETAARTLLLAGGIGITPLLSMAHRLSVLGKPWELVYCGRERGQLAYVQAAAELASRGGGRFSLHIDAEAGSALDLAVLLAAQSEDTHVYCCGPAPMLEAFRAQQACRPQGSLHWEYFAAAPADAKAQSHAGSFAIELARSGAQLQVPAGRSILDVLLEAGHDIDYGCMEGVCGACRTPVLSGQPDHRDFVLSDAEKRSGDCIMLCCSRSHSPSLVLDL